MIVKYNSLNRLEKPKLTLCSPGSTYNNGAITNVVGMLIDHEAEEVVFNFNATSELNFRVNRVHREKTDDNNYAYSLYRAIQNRRLIFLDNIGYFMITSIEDGYSNGQQYKDVKAQSVDIEIQQKMVPFIADGTYRFSTDQSETNKGILETIVETLPLWTIGEVDENVAEKWRTFEDVDPSTNCLSFLLEEVQDAYECIILFDIVNRVINVYDQADYVHKTNIHITKDDLINSIDISESADDLYTAIEVAGDEDLNIGAVNPLGTSVIYNFSYYLDWMTSGLSTKVSNWQTAVATSRAPYYEANLAYYELLEDANDLEAEISRINIQQTMYQRCRDNIVAESSTDLVGSYNTVIVENGGTPIVVYPEIADTLSEIDDLIAGCESDRDAANAELEEINGSMGTYIDAIREIRDALSFENVFTQSELDELANYIFEGSYTDEYVVTTDIMSYSEKFEQMKILYQRAESQLERISSPTQEFNIDVENFIFVKDFAQWSEQLETGCLINVELNKNDFALLFLSNITINYDDHKLTMTFGNRFNKFDPKSLFEDVLGNISKSANTLNYIKDLVTPIKNGEFNAMQEAIQTSRDLTMGAALSSANEEVVIDGSGYTGKKLLDNGTYDPHQIKITGKNIVFTDDAWETCKTAIGELILGDDNSIYGINAEAIIGEIIMGSNLRIIDSNGDDLFTVVDNQILASVSGLSNDIDDLTEQVALCVTQDEFNIAVANISIDEVTTKTGYTFNADGLTVYKSGDEMKNLLDNTGMYVTRSEEEVLTANNEGVTAMNLTSKQYLIVGQNSRFEDYSNGTDTKRTACFYIGG